MAAGDHPPGTGGAAACPGQDWRENTDPDTRMHTHVHIQTYTRTARQTQVQGWLPLLALGLWANYSISLSIKSFIQNRQIDDNR